jgi:hypothetical protein
MSSFMPTVKTRWSMLVTGKACAGGIRSPEMPQNEFGLRFLPEEFGDAL